MSAPIRLTVVMTHPVQYLGPWFRHIAAHCGQIDLTVLCAASPLPEQQGVGFGRPLTWDVPLTEGYRCRVIRPAHPRESVSSRDFWGLDVPEIVPAMRESRPEVVLIPGWHSITLLRALWACRRWGIPVLYRGDSHDGTSPTGWRAGLWRARTRLLLRLFSAHLAVGRRAATYLRRFGLDHTRIFPSPHAVDTAFFDRAVRPYRSADGRRRARSAWGLEPGDFVVLFVGKLEPKKRPLDLVRAAARLKPGARLLVVGAGALEGGCRAEAARLGVGAAWAGFLNQSEIGRAYAAADCLALPSDWGETWGLVVNEALAAGLPAVVSDRVGCAPDLVTPETGETFPFGDVEALTAALGRVRARIEAGHDFAAACRERAALHSFEHATAGLLEACRTVVRRAGDEPRPAGPRVLACCGSMVLPAGLERMTFEVLGMLRERGASVHCVVNYWDSQRIVDMAEAIGASWSTGPYRWRFDRRTRNPIQWARLGWDIAGTSAGLLRDAWRVRPSHVLLPDFVTALRNAPALLLLGGLGVRTVLHLGNAPDPGRFYRRLWRWAVNPLVERFVCNSDFTRTELLAHGIAAGKVSRIHNCVPARSARPAQSGPRDPGRIIYVGQVIPAKGLDLLLEALGILLTRGYDADLDVVGQMEGWVAPGYVGYRERLRARAEQPDLRGRVRFLGWREDVPALLAAAALHCCPSRPEIREGFGLVVLEAKAAGVPSVVFQTGALPELISHGEDGWICPEVTAAALAEGIEYFLKDPDRLERAGAAARRSAGRFSREAFADAWWAEFRGKP